MDNQILSLYIKGVTYYMIVVVFKELYNTDVSPMLVAKVTDALIE